MDSIEFNKSVGVAITSLRERKALKASQLAKCAHISKSKLSRIECGHSSVDVMTLVSIATALDAKIDDIIQLAHVFQHERSRPLADESMKTVSSLRKKLVLAAIEMRGTQ